MILRLLLGLLLALLISLLAYRARALSKGGAAAAALEGTLIFGLGGLPAAVLLMTFFVSSSVLSRLFARRKSRFEEKFSKGSRRDAGQVLANGGAATLFMLIHGLLPGQVWPWVGFTAALAAVNADTWATELGILSRSTPRLLTDWKPVVPGTSGAVSLVGTLAALTGAGLVALAAGLLWQPATGLSIHLLPFFAIMTLSGLAGALFDSLLGASVQAIYRCPACDKETERHPTHTCGTPTQLIRGWTWLNNDLVNTACSLVGAILALAVWLLNPAWSGAVRPASLLAPQGETYMSFPISSTSFEEGGFIPERYTCDGENRSPALAWRDLPSGTRSLALMTDDPDAPVGTFTHWVLYNMPANLSKLAEGINKDGSISGVGTQGTNDFHRLGYDGPCPPKGPAHRYYFTLYALDIAPTLPANLSASQLRKTMQGHILAQSQWVGKYGR